MVLRVKVEIVPLGNEDKTYELGRLDIFNKEYIAFGICDYGVIQLDIENNTGGLYNETVTHRRSHGFWILVEKVLNELVNKDYQLGHLTSQSQLTIDPRKGKEMNEQTLGNAQSTTAERINTLDPSRRNLGGADLKSLDGLNADELEKLIAIKAVDEPIDGKIIGYVTVDVEDEADEDKTLQ